MARALQGPPFPPCLPSFSPPTAAVPKSARPIPSPELPRSRVLLHARTTPLIYLFIPVPLSLFQLLSLSRSLARSLARSFTLAHTHTHSLLVVIPCVSIQLRRGGSFGGALLGHSFILLLSTERVGEAQFGGVWKTNCRQANLFVRGLGFSLGFRA